MRKTVYLGTSEKHLRLPFIALPTEMNQYLQRKYLFCISCFLFLFANVSLAGSTPDSTIRFGLFSVRPIVFLDEDYKASGIYVDLIEEIARLEGWKIEYVPGSWHEGISRLKTGEIDIMPSIAYSPERDEFADFTTETVLTIWGEVYLTPQSKVQNILDLQGTEVGIMKGDINGKNFKTLAKSFHLDCSYVELDSSYDVLQWVKDGKVAAGVVANIFGTGQAHLYGLVKSSIIFDAFPIYFAVPEGMNPKLLRTIDRHLKLWKNDEDSPYYRTLNHWLGGEFENTVLPKWLYLTLAIILVAVLFSALWIKMLRLKIAARTKDCQESEERYRGIFNSTTEAIFIHEAATGAILDANKSMQKMFGYTWEEAIQSSVADLSLGEPPYSSKEAAIFIQAASQGKSQFFEWRCRRRDDSLFWAEVTLKGFSIGGEKLVSAVVRDVTERKILEEQVMQSQKMEAMGTLAGGIAHDFNNILSAIIGYSELIPLHIDNQEQIKEDIANVLKGANRARELVRQILTFSSKREHEKEVLQISLVVKEALKLLRSSIPTTIRIEQEIASQSVVMADPVQIHQVLMNLCTNAFHAMEDEGGVLHVGLTETKVAAGDKLELKPGRYLKMAVSDTGKGMDPATLERIFEPYFTSKEAGRGTGLGLAVVHGIVKKHHGGIYAYSELGMGTTFHVYLPVSDLQEEMHLNEEVARVVGGTERLMIVDDEQDILDFSCTALEAFGYKVTTFIKPAEALTEFMAHPEKYDLLITDMTMPRLTGLELIKAVRKTRKYLPVIICSGFSEKLQGVSSAEQPFTAFCEKPISIYEMKAKIREMLD